MCCHIYFSAVLCYHIDRSLTHRLKKENGKLRKEEVSAFLGYTFCEDYDRSMLLAAHINLR